MLKLLLWLLIVANGALLAFRTGYLDTLFASKGEPLRMANQINADKVRLLAPQPAASATAPAAPMAAVGATPSAPVPAPAPAKPAKIVACVEIGDFATRDTRKIETRLAELALGERQSRRVIQEVATHMVFIPPQGGKGAAEKRAAELKRMGIDNFFIIQDNSKMRWGISLGVFKSEATARSHLASLQKKGVRSAKIGARSVSGSKIAYMLRDMDEKSLSSLNRIMADFPEQKARDCSR